MRGFLSEVVGCVYNRRVVWYMGLDYCREVVGVGVVCGDFCMKMG